ncbi:MAG: translation elongation factor Ts [Candidatus Dasytiphilus stammeri]
MVNVTIEMVKKLRKRTGAGMMNCKKALIEANGNIDVAIDYMRKKGDTQSAAKRLDYPASEGIIMIKIDENCAAMIEINCETDFVSQNATFKNFADRIISSAVYDRIKDIEIIRSKFKEEQLALMNAVGENIYIRRISVIEVEDKNEISYYLHRSRIGVIVTTTCQSRNKELGKHIAMHIAASKPEYIKTELIPINIVEREREIQKAIAIKSGKSPNILEKIIDGRIKKYFDELTLVCQKFIFEPTKTVAQVLKENNTQVITFTRFSLGESE